METQAKPLTKGQRTHLRLLDATLRLIRSDGLPALTTGRIAAEAGLAQSSFYQHFRNLDACIEEAGRRVAQKIRPASPQLVERALSVLHSRDDLPALVEMLVNALVLPHLEAPELTSLYYRYQHDPSPFGRAMDAIMVRERAVLRSLWFDAARRLGVSEDRMPVVALQAELVNGLGQAAIRTLIHGQFDNRDLVLGQLRVMIEGGIRQNLAVMDHVEALTRPQPPQPTPEPTQPDTPDD